MNTTELPPPPSGRTDVIAWFPTFHLNGEFLEWKPFTYDDAAEAERRALRWICTIGTDQETL